MDTITPPTPSPENLNHKQLKALSKASRPWYAKKRFWALGVIGVIVIAMAANSGGSKGTTKTTSNGGVSTLSDNGSNPPQADVAIESCATDVAGDPTAGLRITNHSSGRSDYMVSVNFLDASGTKIAEGTAISNNIDPGQAAVESATGFTQASGAVTCKVTNVDRFASH
jgi:hypothetical protein